jgi:hypothetical protein
LPLGLVASSPINSTQGIELIAENKSVIFLCDVQIVLCS